MSYESEAEEFAAASRLVWGIGILIAGGLFVGWLVYRFALRGF